MIAWLVVTAVPAFAISSCTYDNQGTVASDDILTVTVDTDDHVWLLIENNNSFTGPAEDDVFIVENGDTIRECTGGGNDIDDLQFVNVNGSNAGNETFTIVNREDGAGGDDSFGSEGPAIEFTVDLGNGTDTLEIEYGGVAFSDSLSAEDDEISDVGNHDTTELGSSNSGDWINLEDDFNGGGPEDDDDNSANILVVDAENIIINGGEGHDDTDVETASAQFQDFAGDLVRGPFNLGYTFNGGSDDDLAEFATADSTFNGGAGDDEADFQDHPDAVTVDLGAGTASGAGGTFTLTDVQDAVGSAFADTLTGSNLDNDIDGMQGDDDIFGLGGNDGAGSDAIGIAQGLQGGAGVDEITDGPGNDVADGGAGDDILHQEAAPNGTDVLDDSGGGLDTLDYGQRSTSTVINQTTNVCGEDANADGDSGDPGDEGDTCSGYDRLVTGSGNDTLVGNGSGELFVPGLGDDSVEGGAGTDVLDLSRETPTFTNEDAPESPEPVTTGASTIDLQAGTATGPLGTDSFSSIEQFITGGGDDVLIPNDGDVLDPAASTFDWYAGGGEDTIDASSTNIGVTVDLSNMGAGTGGGFFTPVCNFGGPGLANGTCIEVEHAVGGGGDDTLAGSNEDNDLGSRGPQPGDLIVPPPTTANAGNDVILGGNGNDFIHGGLGNDTLDGMAGNDTASYRDAASGVEIDNQAIFGGGSTGGAGSDTFVTGFERVLLSDFDDSLRSGQTFLDANLQVFGFSGNDEITGSNSVDVLRGGAANDIIRGGNGDDNVIGSGGNDLLIGSAGSDILRGGAGTDEGRGGRNFDRCLGVEIEVSC
jgi:Ca2+-binding RTX toxin-like protein